MTAEELKARLMAAEEEGADRAGIYDEAVAEFSRIKEELTSSTAKIEELTNRVGQLTDTNFKLLEKIRYVDKADDVEDPAEEEIHEMSIEELFEEE